MVSAARRGGGGQPARPARRWRAPTAVRDGLDDGAREVGDDQVAVGVPEAYVSQVLRRRDPECSLEPGWSRRTPTRPCPRAAPVISTTLPSIRPLATPS